MIWTNCEAVRREIGDWVCLEGRGENGDGKRRRDFPDRMGMKGASEGSSPLKALKASSVLTGTRDEGSLREPRTWRTCAGSECERVQSG